MRSLWATLLLTLATVNLSEAILLPENVIPSVATTRGKRQATSQCSQTVIPITMTCSTPSPAKRQKATIAGTPAPAGVVVRDAPTPTCSQVYITSEKCSDASGPDYAGTTMTVPPSNTIPGLPGGTTGTVETAALIAGVCPANTKSPWEVQMTPELRDRILDIANEVCSKNGNPVHARPRQGSEYLNHPQCNFHAMGSQPQQDFIASVKSDIQPKVYYPFSSPADLDCLPEGWADYPHHEQLVADVVAAFIGYAFDLGWNLWETFNVPAEFGASAMSAPESSTQSGSSSSGSTLHDTAGDPPTKSTSSSSSTTQKPDPGPKQSKTTKSTSSTSSADACPTGIEIDPDEDQGQDGPTPTDQIPIVPIATVTGKLDLPCQAHLDPHNDDCNVCTCSGKDTSLTVPMYHQTYMTPVKGSMITTSDACFYTSWPDTKSISTTTCLDGNQIAQSKSIQSAMAEISKHIYPSDYTPGAPIPTCSPDPNHKMPICDLKNGGKDNLPPKYCLCPGPTPSISTPYSTTYTSLVSCDTQLGTVTHLDVCPWTTTPPDSMKIDTTQHGSPYPAGTLPIVQTTTPSCVPRTAGADQPAFLGSYIMDTARRFCREAVDEKWTVGPGGAKYKFQTYDDADRARNSLGDPRPQRLTLFVQWDERACPADFDDDHYEFRDFDGCVKEMSDAALKCDRRQMLLKPGDLGSVVMYWFGGGYYGSCLWWEVLASDKFRP